MSKRINYNKDENTAPVDRAIIVPHAAPNAVKRAKSSKMTKGTKALAIVLVILAVIAITFAIIGLIINSYMAKISTTHYEDVKFDENDLNKDITNVQAQMAEKLNPDGYEDIRIDTLENFAEASHSVMSEEHIINFAIYGINKDTDASGGVASFVSVVSFNKETKGVSFAVFKEKILVYIPEREKVGGLQDAYEYGGAALLTKTIKYNFAIDINGYIEVNMKVAARLIDEIDGIEINANSTEVDKAIDSYNEHFGKNVEHPKNSGGNKVKLLGEQALAYLRADYANSNDVFKVLGEKVFKSGLSKIIDCAEIIVDETTASIQKEDFIDVIGMAFAMFGDAATKTTTIGESTFKTLSFNNGNNYIFHCNLEEERAILCKAFYNVD